MKTTVVKGVLTSYELMLATYLGWVLYCAVTILCGSDTVPDLVTGWIITFMVVFPMGSLTDFVTELTMSIIGKSCLQQAVIGHGIGGILIPLNGVTI